MFNVTIATGQSATPVQLASAFQDTGPGGWRLDFTETGTMSCVLYQNTNPPGTVLSASNLTTVAYYDSDGVAVGAGTAITASGYVTVDKVNQDLYVIATLTGATSTAYITRQVSPNVAGEPVEGYLTADSPQFSGTMTATTSSKVSIAGATGATTFGGVMTLTDATDSTTSTTGAVKLTGGMGVAKALFVGTTVNAGSAATFVTTLKYVTAAATPSALSATQYTGFASTVSGAAVMGYGTANDVALMNRAGTVCLGVGPNTTLVNIPGPLAVTGASTLLSVAAQATPASVGTTPGTPAPTMPITTNTGGATSIATTGVGGKGGDASVVTGAGGTAALAVTAGAGGGGGGHSGTTGAGVGRGAWRGRG